MDKTAFVTGAAGGIGAACVRRLHADGYRVAACDRDLDALRQVFGDLAKADTLLLEVDVCESEAVELAVQHAESELGAIWVAVNAAGVGAEPAPIHIADVRHFAEVLNINLIGTVHCLQSEARAMIRTGTGSIINVSSVLGSRAMPNVSSYVAAKHGVEGVTKAAAIDLAEFDIRVNCVAPGFIDTPLLRQRRDGNQLHVIEQMHPLARLGTVDEVASMVAFLGSEESSFVTGSSLAVDGGFLSR